MMTSGRGPKRLKYLPVKVMAANEASDQGTIRAPIAPGAIPVTRCR